VRIQRNDVSFADVGTNANEAALGGALESLSLDGTLMSLLIHSTLEEASEARSQMTGEVHASVQTALVENTARRDAATERVRDAFLVAEGKKPRARRAGGSGASSRPSAPDGPAAWISGYGWLASHDATDVSAAFERRNVGVLGGMDISDANWRLGVLAGYERSAMEAGDLASTANAGHVHAGIYGGGQWGGFGLRTGVGYTWSDIDTSRYVAFLPENLTASYSASTMQAFGELGLRRRSGRALVESFVNLAHVRSSVEAFSETGGIAALDTEASSVSTTFATLGLRADG